VDVDGTLLLWPGETPGIKNDNPPEINWPVVFLLRNFREDYPDAFIAVWSANGLKHAEYATAICGLEETVTCCLPKPVLFIDDAFGWFTRHRKLIVNYDEEVQDAERRREAEGGGV
jgi:hypothetical protein